MATKTLFQILLRNRDGIKQGITKVQDIVTEYLTSTGSRGLSERRKIYNQQRVFRTCTKQCSQ